MSEKNETEPTIPAALRRMEAEIRDDVIQAVANSLITMRKVPLELAESLMDDLWRIVEALQITCTDLCSHGVSYKQACAFVQLEAPAESDRWLSDSLFPPLDWGRDEA